MEKIAQEGADQTVCAFFFYVSIMSFFLCITTFKAA